MSQFKTYLNRFVSALGSILPVFTYLNRFYVEAKLETDLQTVLTKLFQQVMNPEVIDKVVGKEFRKLVKL